MNIIGISGPAQSGKDTVANVLVDEFNFTKVSFADGVRDFMVRLDPMLEHLNGNPVRLSTLLRDLYDWEWLKANTNARDHMVAIGAGAREVMGNDVWIRTAFLKMQQEPWRSYVIPDCRYANEAYEIRRRGGEVWGVTRPGFDPVNAEEARSLKMFTADRAVLNGRGMDDLQSYVRSLGVMGQMTLKV